MYINCVLRSTPKQVTKYGDLKKAKKQNTAAILKEINTYLQVLLQNVSHVVGDVLPVWICA